MLTANMRVLTEEADTSGESAAMARMRAGDVSGLQALMQRHQTEALRTAFLILGDRQAAEDIVADAFLTVFYKAAQFDVKRPFKPWFYRIVTNGALQWLRRNKFSQAWEDAGELNDTDDPPDEQAMRRDRAARVTRQLTRLAPEQRVVIVLRYFHDLDDTAIARTLGIPVATVRWRAHWAKRKLHDWLSNDAAMDGYWEEAP